EHDDVLLAPAIRGRALLVRALLRELGRREGAVGRAGIAIGAQHVRHLTAAGDPSGHDAARSDLRVVGVGEDDHGPLGHVRHDLELPVVVWLHPRILQDRSCPAAIWRGVQRSKRRAFAGLDTVRTTAPLRPDVVAYSGLTLIRAFASFSATRATVPGLLRSLTTKAGSSLAR